VFGFSKKLQANQEQNYFHSNRWFCTTQLMEQMVEVLQMIDVNEVKVSSDHVLNTGPPRPRNWLMIDLENTLRKTEPHQIW
jgi:hypothetical protein